ncbi:MAG: endonuclease [Lutibacter sp.]|nr:MAG: endonuclease [Lutibacter sp.]
MFSYFKSKEKSKNAFTIAFYNLENLFDTVDDPKTFDDDFTSGGKLKWSKKRYFKKINKLSHVIKQLGTEKSFVPPVLVGVAEVENKKVLEDLVRSKNLQKFHYDYVHYDSMDDRGIDVGLLYNKQLFELLHSERFSLYIENEDGEQDFTRDVLLVKGNFNGELMYILVNHWPSRRQGTEESDYKRVKASELNREIIDKIRFEDENAKIVVMGDFNDNPNNNSIQNLIKDDFYNPMQSIVSKGKGTLKYKDDWYLFDQIIFSKNFKKAKEDQHSFKYAEVFDRDFMKVFKGKNKGKPFRTYIGPWYQGGFSDHFPVYVYLKKMSRPK